MKKVQNKQMQKMGNGAEMQKSSVHALMVQDGEIQDITLNEAEVESLLYMIEEEKMARDIYDALYELTGIESFDVISNSEQKHYDKLLEVASKAGVDTTTISDEAGVYINSEIQDLYTTLLAQGSLSSEDALSVGILIEQTDIADLQSTLEETDITLLGQVYSHLLDASQNHFAAFESIA
ncbi:MAG: hypothetical protein C0627_06470 [Sulfurimonas sp.]|nr:MAG: hypothetical protein C0627_06470 [Sulfurimonas sp.]